MISEQDLLDRFEAVQRSGPDSWHVRCPAHDDDRPSLHITRAKDRWLLHCLADCPFENVISAARLEAADLFGEPTHETKKTVATYDYRNDRDEVVFQVVRYQPKDFRFRRKDPATGEWIWNLKGVQSVPYRLPELITAVKNGERVWIFEGEKDVHTAVERYGVAATCNPMGAGKWLKQYAWQFKGANVAVVADNDEAGLKHAHDVVRSVQAVAEKVVLVGVPDGRKDLSDHAAAGGKLSELVPLPISAEHAERTPGSPAGKGDSCSVGAANTDRTRTEHKPPNLAFEARILDRFDEEMGERGLIGERHIARAVYLVHISRLLPKPARQVTKGDSSTGKSYATECALELSAPEYMYIRTSTSALALFYTERDLRHHTLVFYEANKLGDEDDDLARVVRTLLSEDKLKHEVTDVKKMTTTLLEKEGPVAFISTVARPTLDPEIETRIVSLHSDGSDEQTGAVVKALLEAAAAPKDSRDVSEWHRLDRWLASHVPADVIVPWGSTLASFNISGPPRLRRDITNLLSLAKAHALLHRASRDADPRGRVIANLDDYEIVHSLLSKALAIATDKAVRREMRQIVDAVAELRSAGEKAVSIRAASKKAGKAVSTTSHDVHDAIDKGYLVNKSPKVNRYDLDIGEPMPTQEELLPSRAELEERVRSVFGRCSVGGPNTESPVNTGDSGSCSACSVDFEDDEDSEDVDGWHGSDDDPVGWCEDDRLQALIDAEQP